jgi:hypothetical protein
MESEEPESLWKKGFWAHKHYLATPGAKTKRNGLGKAEKRAFYD